MSMHNPDGVNVSWSRSTIGGFILLFAAVFVLIAGFVYSGSLTLVTDSDAMVHTRLVSGICSILAGCMWCGAAYLMTQWRRRYLTLTMSLTGVGATLIVAGVAALPAFSNSGQTLIMITGMGFLLTVVIQVIVAVMMRRTHT